MKLIAIFMMLLIAVTFGGCAGSTEPDTEETEAFKADLLEHTGDTGDIIKNSHGQITDTLNCYYGSDSTFYELENNGIDAYHEGDWILVPWRHISDPATVSLELFRFSYMQYQNNQTDSLTAIAYIPFNNYTDDFYIDSFAGEDDVVDNTWLYFLKTTNASGAVAYSDTVGYRLVNKPLLREPYNLEEFSQSDTIIFKWELNTSSSLIKHRLLVFDESYHLVWFYNLLANEEPEINFSELAGLTLETGNYFWRVDAVIEFFDELAIDGKIIEIHSGAESMERILVISEAGKHE
jgi:hypothetical protein